MDIAELPEEKVEKPKKKKIFKPLNASKRLALGYLMVILLGTLILCTPFVRSSFNWSWESFKSNWSNPLDALFTATSAACVTGLITQNTATYWNFGGQIVILALIQIGGLGFMSILSIFSLIFRRKMDFNQRKMVMQASGVLEFSDVVAGIKRVIFYTLLFEVIGIGLLCIDFIPRFGTGQGIWYSVFTSISAFCNAGFALFSNNLESFYSNPLVLITVMFLIASGGLGFIVWNNLFDMLFKKSKMMLHSKLVLVGTLIMIVVPAFLFFLFEFNGIALENMTAGEKLLNCFFQSVTCRTAGFSSFDLTKLSNGSLMLSDVLMLIGGCSGGTAGGIKLSTMIVLILSMVTITKKGNVVIAKRRIPNDIIRQASAVFAFYMIILSIAMVGILVSESLFNNKSFTFSDVLFESASAIGTVGLSTGGTALLTWPSKVILILLMYIGRTGGLTVIYALTERETNKESKVLERPQEKVLIG